MIMVIITLVMLGHSLQPRDTHGNGYHHSSQAGAQSTAKRHTHGNGYHHSSQAGAQSTAKRHAW